MGQLERSEQDRYGAPPVPSADGDHLRAEYLFAFALTCHENSEAVAAAASTRVPLRHRDQVVYGAGELLVALPARHLDQGGAGRESAGEWGRARSCLAQDGRARRGTQEGREDILIPCHKLPNESPAGFIVKMPFA